MPLMAVIGRPDQRSAFDVVKPQCITDLSQFGKFVGVNKANDRQVFFCRLKILTQGDDVDAAVTKVRLMSALLPPCVLQDQA